MSKKCDVKNEKGILVDKRMHTCGIPAKLNFIITTGVAKEQCIVYATPGELLQSNLYGCGGLEINLAYNGIG